MAKSNSKMLQAHRVIGIRHVLRAFKGVGLVENDSMYAAQAIGDVTAEALAIAKNWYRIGAKRGALEIIETFLDGKFEIHIDKKGRREVIAHTKKVLWEKRLKITVGNRQRIVPKEKYSLTPDDLGFGVPKT
jgi:hypothetical protein